MTGNPAPPVACRQCGSLLNRYLDLSTGEARFTHPARQLPHHEPDPVPADHIDARYACDFCSDERIVYTFRTGLPIQTLLVAGRNELVQARNLPGLHARIMDLGQPFDQQVAGQLHTMLETVLDSLLPGRALAANGRWPPTPPPATTLPKVRDRLTKLIRGTEELPVDLNRVHTRAQFAASLDAARLYWIDDEFTDLVRHAAASLPRTPFTAANAPAPHGLLAWAQPVGGHTDLIAASWSCGPDGTCILGYRSIGTGLPPAALQRLREQVGWLVPRHTITLQLGQIIDAASPAGSVIATWLLIGQKLAEATPATLDRSIRKAYQRTGRPTPEVHLVRIRGADPGPEREAGRGAGAPGREYQYRWWVRGHWRNQPYGPGRSQRRLIYIDPQIRGPENKPIKTNTTVRILSSQSTPDGPRPPRDRPTD